MTREISIYGKGRLGHDNSYVLAVVSTIGNLKKRTHNEHTYLFITSSSSKVKIEETVFFLLYMGITIKIFWSR